MAFHPAVVSSTVSGEAFSTGEALTGGVWTDGRPIYRKVIDLGALPNVASKLVAHGLVGISKVIRVYGCCTDGTYRFPLPLGYPMSQYASVALLMNGPNIEIATGENRSAFTGHAVLEFTKT